MVIESGLESRGVDPDVRRARIRERQQAIIDAAPKAQLNVLRRYENLSGFVARGDAAAVEALAQHPWVSLIYADRKAFASLIQGVPLVGADRAHALGFTGLGVSVAVIDSGIDTDHPDLLDDIVEERCWCSGGAGPINGCCPNGLETMSGAGAAEDVQGHGTTVSGIVTSGGVVAADGVAPDAGIVAIKTLDNSGGGTFSDIDAALDWLITNHAIYDVRVVNLSISDGAENTDASVFPCSGSVTSNAISDLTALGIAVVASSGNDAFDAGIGFPACVADAISVGGVYDANIGSISWCSPTTCTPPLCTDSTTAADQFVCHTNSSSELDLLAPDWRTATSALGGGTTNFGGTSASAPYVSGLAALLFEQDPSRTPSDALTVMTSGAPMVVNPDNALSFPRADVSSAFPVCGDGIVEGGEDCDDGNLLSGDCCSSICVYEGLGSSCDDGNACTAPDQCDGAGLCAPGTPLNCDDGEFCNGTETCDAGLGCQPGAAVPVDDGVGCTDDSCDEVGDTVLNTPNNGLCDNGQFCDGAETCDAALDCQPGTAVPVDDGVGCTDDSCDEVLNLLSHVPDDLACDDGDPCTADACDALAGCSNAPIPGCGVAVPAGGPTAHGLLLLGLLVTGLGSLGRRLR
ncbi:MAG: S8 family serine peptidase [Myxococcota bacterium]|nr:S8 family serine peptidase [Myxococcota bacterium]